MAQIELEEQDLENIDEMIKIGMFPDRKQAIKAGLESLLRFSKEDIEKMKKAQIEVNSYCEIHLGSILYAGAPIKVVADGREHFKIPVKGEYEGRTYTYGHLYVNVETLVVDEQLSDSREKIHKTAEQLTGYDGTII